MALSDFRTDIGKVFFSRIPIVSNFTPMFLNSGHRWIQDAGRESDLKSVKEDLFCESNGVVRFQNRQVFSWIPIVYQLSPLTNLTPFSYLNVDHDPKFNRREPHLFQSAVVYDYIAFLASEMLECFRFSLRNTLAAHRSKKHC